MKKNAILVAGILFVAGCASQRGHYGRAGVETGSSDYSASVVDTSSPHHIMADSSVRGGSMDARGYNQNLNEQEVTTHPMNPAYQADSSVRGGSTAGRNSEWNNRPEPGEGNGDTHIKADSSKRGGSMSARGYDRFSSNYPDESDHVYTDSGVSGAYQSDSSDMDDAAMESDLRQDSDLAQGGFDAVIIEGPVYEQDRPLANEDFGQGGSERLGGNGASDSNFNPSDDLMPDNQLNDSNSTAVGRAAETSVGTGSSKDQSVETSKSNLDDIDIQSTSDDSKNSDQSSSDQGSARKNGQLNSSPNLEKDISGEFQTGNPQNNPDQKSSTSQSDVSSGGRLNSDLNLGSNDPNARDTFESSVNSSRSTDINHNSSDVGPSVTSEASGTAATSETGRSSSSDTENQDASISGSVSEKSSALPGPNSRITSEAPNWLMKDNPALGLGSAATGEQGAAFSSDASTMSNDQLAQKVKAELTKESTGTHDMLASEVARNIKVTANNGVVTLKGSVPTQKDKDIIAIRAQEVKGVTRIDNQLKINPESNPDTRDLTKGHDLDENVQQTQP